MGTDYVKRAPSPTRTEGSSARARSVGGPVMRQHEVARAGVGVRALVPDPARRRVGRWGTVARVLVGSGLIVVAIAVWRADWLDLVIGLIALPAVATLVM